MSSASSLSAFPAPSSMNFYKLSQILMDHGRYIQWCKEHNLLASSVQCPRAQCMCAMYTYIALDSTKFIAKYHRGRYVKGQWVFGGICRETKACFLVPVERRDKDTLLPIIRAQILPGTCVMSDMWKTYDCLRDEGYNHLTVKHSLNFVDLDTGSHTQCIENTWWEINEVCLVQEHP